MRTATVKTSLQGTAGTLNGNALPSEQVFYCSVQAVATGNLAGTVKLQASNDIVNPANPTGLVQPTNWFDITGATVTLTGTAGAFGIPKTEICYAFIRPVFTASGGSGTVSVNMQTMGQT